MRASTGRLTPRPHSASGAVLEGGMSFGDRSEHDSLVRLIEGEGMEELSWPILPGDELYVVDEVDFGVHVFAPELLHRLAGDRADEIVGEGLRGDVNDPQLAMMDLRVVADSLHQMGLAKANAPVQKQGVVGPGGSFRHGQGGGVGKAIAVADDKSIEGILGVQGRGGRLRDSSRRGGGSFGLGDDEQDLPIIPHHLLKGPLQISVAGLDSRANSLGTSTVRRPSLKEQALVPLSQVSKLGLGSSCLRRPRVFSQIKSSCSLMLVPPKGGALNGLCPAGLPTAPLPRE